VTSPTHKIAVQHVPGESTALIALAAGHTQLDKDFVLLVSMAEPHAPRLMIEESAQHGPVAVVTLAPAFELENIPSEILFLVDRSGSMSGSKMEQVRQAMQLFLRSLPTDSYFNIISFGSSFVKLFETSQAYAQASLQAATTLVASFTADLGGTELLEPLAGIFKAPVIPERARQIFVLTDGEVRLSYFLGIESQHPLQVSNTQEVIHEVERGATRTGSRVFTLGLGHGASHELVDGIARVGKGKAVYSTDPKERLEAKVVNRRVLC
jgi:uncharacterized protein YegL